jgi:electron transfer flavoprotein alpha/beta subunit
MNAPHAEQAVSGSFPKEAGRLKEHWNVPVLNPDDSAAVAQALRIKETVPEAQITIVHLGPPSGDRFIWEALALGCDEGLRIWDEELEDLHTRGKLSIFAGGCAMPVGRRFMFPPDL